jgi:uncharacterized protein
MSRLIMLVVIAALVYLLIKSYRRNTPGQDKDVSTDAEDMVRCAKCGVHLPKSESVMSQGQFFCSAAHRDAYLK